MRHMNNFHRMSKRKRQAMLFFTYGFMTLATIGISAVCLLLILGYRFDVTDRKIEQGGLMQFRSTPAGASIRFDESQLGFRTPGKLDVATGSHTVTMQREGYNQWSKTVSITAGELLWLNYARLIPKKITTTALVTLPDGVTSALSTPDRRFVAAVGDAARPQVHILDMRNKTAPVLRTIAIPTEQLTVAPDQSSHYAIIEWDFGSRFLLVSHTTGDITEYIRLDRTAEDGAARNITKEFNLQFRDMHFSGTSGAILYALTGGDIRKIDTNAGSVSQPLVTGVESYKLYRENDIVFVALRADKRIAGVYINDKETIVRSVASSQPMLAAIGQYYSHYYAAITTSGGVDVIKDPVETGEAAAKVYARLAVKDHDMSWLDVSHSGRFIVSGDSHAYSLYDLETENSYRVEFDTDGDSRMPVEWLDDFYVVSTTSGTARISEFDGQNQHDIVAASAKQPAFLSEDGTYMYSFTTKNDASVLQASRLILE